MMRQGIAELFQRMWKIHSGENFASNPLYGNLSNIMVVMWNMTDKCTALCERSLNIGLHKDALKYMNAINPEDTIDNLRYTDLQTNHGIIKTTVTVTTTKYNAFIRQWLFNASIVWLRLQYTVHNQNQNVNV